MATGVQSSASTQQPWLPATGCLCGTRSALTPCGLFIGGRSEAPVIGYTIGETPSAEYGWFRLTDEADDTPQRWVAARFVSGCSHLSSPIVFTGNQVLGNTLDSSFPAPPSDYLSGVREVPCVEGIGLTAARIDCVAQVYVAFFQEFLSQAGRPPAVRDLLAYFAVTELLPNNTLAPRELLLATAINVNIGYCFNSSMRSSCNAYDLIDLLEDSDWWIHRAGSQGPDQAAIAGLVEQILSDEVHGIINTIADEPLTQLLQLDGLTPIAWGNWYYGTTGYNAIAQGTRPVMYCEFYRQVDSNGPYAYIFAIQASEQNPINDTNYRSHMVGIPDLTGLSLGLDNNCPLDGTNP